MVNSAGEKSAKKILFCEGNVDGTVGGSYYVLFDLVTHLNKKKYYPVVVFQKDNFLIPKLKDEGIETHVFERLKAVNFTLDLKNYPSFVQVILKLMLPFQKIVNLIVRFIVPGIKIARYLKKNQIDMVNLNNSITRNHEWMLAAKIAGIKCMTHEMGINNHFSYTSRIFGRQMEGIICVSYAVSDNMKNCGLNYSNIITIHNGIDFQRYHIQKSPDELRKIYQIDKQSPVIGVVGNIKLWKGQETVVRATALIKKKWPGIRCLLVGDISEEDIDYKNKLVELCDEFNITENVIFTGFQKNAVDYMNFMDIVIHSSIDPEPFGIVLLEAMWAKKPIISTNIGAPPEVVIDGGTGILITPGKPEDLDEAVNSLLSNPSLAKEMGQAAYKRLFQSFTLERNVQQTEAFYNKMLSA